MLLIVAHTLSLTYLQYNVVAEQGSAFLVRYLGHAQAWQELFRHGLGLGHFGLAQELLELVQRSPERFELVRHPPEPPRDVRCAPAVRPGLKLLPERRPGLQLAWQLQRRHHARRARRSRQRYHRPVGLWLAGLVGLQDLLGNG
jgi:hypothetical protein